MVYRSQTVVLGCLSGVILGSASASGGVIDPRGVYFHSYSGASSAVEWIHIWDIEGENRYQFSDIRGIAPYNGEILSNGQITWDTTALQSGSGMFTSPDELTQSLTYFGGNYTSVMRRAPGTDTDFITRIDSRTDGDAGINGEWDIAITQLNAATGEVIGIESMSATTTVAGDLLRLTYDDGTYFQGVFEDGDHAGFRVVLPNGGLAAPYRSFVGSETSLTMNLLGDFRMTGADSFSATFLTQTRTSPGSQDQFVHVVTGVRAVPTPGTLGVVTMIGMFASRRRRG